VILRRLQPIALAAAALAAWLAASGRWPWACLVLAALSATSLLLARRAAAALHRAEEQLRHSLRVESLGRLAGGVAHDLNNLLTAVSGYSEILLAGLSQDHELWTPAAEVFRAADRATSLTRQLLAFGRRQTLELKEFPLHALVEELSKMLRRLIGEHIELGVGPTPRLGCVRADPGQIEQVLLNLVVNARDAMPQGGRVTIEVTDVELDSAYARRRKMVPPGAYVLLSVSDTGSGIDPKVQNQIFEPFFTTKEPGKGTGLGLSTVYGIVKQSGGFIWVYSEPGHGAVFKVYLPRVDQVAGAARRETAAAPAELRGIETILLVEDEDLVRRFVSRLLRHGGYQVLEACGGEPALSLCRSHPGPIHLLLTDAIMPGLTGPQVAELAVALRPDLKVLFMSGYTEQSFDRQGLLPAGAPFLPKPFSAADLAGKLREILEPAAIPLLPS